MFEAITDYLTHLFNKSHFAEQDKSGHYDQTINGSYKAASVGWAVKPSNRD